MESHSLTLDGAHHLFRNGEINERYDSACAQYVGIREGSDGDYRPDQKRDQISQRNVMDGGKRVPPLLMRLPTEG